MLFHIRKILIILLLNLISAVTPGQPEKSFFVVHCDPNEAYNFPNLEVMVDSADSYGLKLTIEFTAPWINNILPVPSRMNKIVIWQSKGHEIAIHHHEVTAHGIWDGYSNLPMTDIFKAGRDTNDFIGDMDSLFNRVQQITTLPLQTIGVEDSLEMPEKVLYQTSGIELSQGYSNPVSYSVKEKHYCRLTHCFIGGDLLKEQQLENNYTAMKSFYALGSNCHVHDFVSDPLPVLRFFRFVKQKGILPLTVSGILQEKCAPSSVEKKITPYEIHVYPDPFADLLTISAECSNSLIPHVAVYSVSGLLMKHYFQFSGKLTIETAAWQKGIYFIVVQVDDRKPAVKKIIKM